MKKFNDYLYEMEEIQNEMTGQETLLTWMVGVASSAGAAGWAWYVINDILKGKSTKELSENQQLKEEIKERVKQIKANPELEKKAKDKSLLETLKEKFSKNYNT